MGHTISPKRVEMYPGKMDSVMGWPKPITLKELRGFLGLKWYYPKFIKRYCAIAKPLTKLLKRMPFDGQPTQSMT